MKTVIVGKEVTEFCFRIENRELQNSVVLVRHPLVILRGDCCRHGSVVGIAGAAGACSSHVPDDKIVFSRN